MGKYALNHCNAVWIIQFIVRFNINSLSATISVFIKLLLINTVT